jgi:hypothetical protein
MIFLKCLRYRGNPPYNWDIYRNNVSMVLDLLMAFGLAGNIAQFMDFSCPF